MISIIVPVYNEGPNIVGYLHSLEKTVKLRHEVLIIFDFDGDNTVPQARKLKKIYHNIRLIKNKYGPGLINACKTGFEECRGQYIVVMPADLADDPHTINVMYQAAQQRYDIICATRYSKGGRQYGGKFLKSFLSRMAGLLTPLLLGIPTSDLTNGYKMYQRQVIKTIPIESKGGWEFGMEILIKAYHRGFKITEVPSVWKDRISGESKFKLSKWLPLYIYWYWWGIIKRLSKIV